ncbi:MAG TPA: Tol-Pal system beta propeller repeat protein TolB [Thermoanaerobaculia bacterium]|nr:Tol-Pal system beta propeller repeat protein TolB [Thermoanaerobaculia bacterium]
MSPSIRRFLAFTFVPVVVLVAGVTWIAAAAPPQEPEVEVESADPQADAQSDRVQVVLETDRIRDLIRLAFPEIEGVGAFGGDLGRAARELDATLRADLEGTRIFRIHGPWAFSTLRLTGDRAHDFEQYRSLGDEIVILGEVRPERDRLVFEGRVYDLASGQAILAKRYRGPATAGRRMAHTFADEVVEFLAGRRGIAMTRIAFTSDRSGTKEVWVMDYDGANQRQITAHRSVSMSPAWAPSSAWLTYTSFVGGAPGVYRADLATGRKTPIATDGEQNISAEVSPDGRRIVFSRALGANSEIFTADVGGGNLRRLTHTSAIDTNPSWSPTGAEIAFTSNRAGNPHLFVMDAEGTNVRRISSGGTYNDGGAWSPEGDRIAYATRQRGTFHIVVTDLVSLATRVLTSGPGSHEEPSFSPDGRRIAFSSTRSGAKQIWVMDADGANPQALTGQGVNGSPAWSPYPTR